MIELNKYKLGDLGFFFGGVTSIKKEDYGHGTPFLPYKNVYKNSKVNINELELMNVRPLDLDRRSGVYGDIFFTASSETPDEVAMSSVLLDEVENLTYNGFCKRFRLNDFETLLPEYARYLFRDISFRREVYNLATGDIRFNISQESLANIEIEIPDLPTQKQIAQILSSLDDKIELNLQMNQTLEAMAQVIFKEWFVNFNFPGFDGELVDGLPKGWRLGVLGELVDKLSKGTTPTQKDLGSLEVEIPFLKVKDISDNGSIIKSNLELIPSEVHQNQLKRSILETDDILFSIAGTIGRVAILDDSLNNSNCNQAIAFVRLKDKAKLLEFVHQWLKNDTVQNNIKSSIVQGVQANVSLTVLSNIEIIIPDDSTLHHWNSLIKPIYSRLLTNTYQIEYLTQTRDTLLPKLMSGQLEVV
ncbi:MAG: restriction endonuclease subunit S [Bacteroidia bacterium]